MQRKINSEDWPHGVGEQGKKISGKEISALRARNPEREHEVWTVR